MKKLLVTAAAVSSTLSLQAFAAVSSVIPADLATDQATIAGDVATAGGAVIAIVLTALGVRKVIGMFS